MPYTAAASELEALFESACGSVGIDGDRCTCIRQQVIERHGEAAARYVVLDMNLRYDDAAAAMQQVGEDAAFAASETFETAQHKECSSGRLARQKGEYAAASPGGASVSSSAVAAEQQPGPSATTITEVFAAGQSVPIIDLTAHAPGGILDVSAKFSAAALASSGSRNLRNFIGFYPVVDASGGIDVNGDGTADVMPGDDNYSTTAQARTLPTKLYWQSDAGNQQVLGEVRLPGGKRYAPLVMYRSNKPAARPTMDFAAMREQVKRGMATNANLYFAFDRTDPDAAARVRKVDERSFGFQASGSDTNDITVVIDGLTLD
ncbi:MAG: hypothetical protein AAFN78_16305 [Pseudomonadota bacterium]